MSSTFKNNLNKGAYVICIDGQDYPYNYMPTLNKVYKLIEPLNPKDNWLYVEEGGSGNSVDFKVAHFAPFFNPDEIWEYDVS